MNRLGFWVGLILVLAGAVLTFLRFQQTGGQLPIGGQVRAVRPRRPVSLRATVRRRTELTVSSTFSTKTRQCRDACCVPALCCSWQPAVGAVGCGRPQDRRVRFVSGKGVPIRVYGPPPGQSEPSGPPPGGGSDLHRPTAARKPPARSSTRSRPARWTGRRPVRGVLALIFSFFAFYTY